MIYLCKNTPDKEMHKMTIVLEYVLYNFLFDSARIGHEYSRHKT